MDAKLTIFDAAKWFIENNDSVTPKKLQKLLYYLYAWGLVFLNEDIDDLSDKVFSGEFEAWVHGPVNRDVYERYKPYGGNLIKIPDANEMKIENPDTLNLMKQIQKERGSSIIFITHDLGVVAGMADRVAVMYAGKIIEYGTVDEVFYNPQHPYTWGLLNSMPTTDTEAGSLQSIPGTPPDLLNPPKGDAFAPRNEFALDIDYEEEPPMFKVSDTHFAATWLLDERAPKVTPPLPIQKRWAKWKELEGRKA